jgi:hypothetical protein
VLDRPDAWLRITTASPTFTIPVGSRASVIVPVVGTNAVMLKLANGVLPFGPPFISDFGILIRPGSAVCFGPPCKRTGTLIRAKPEAEETRWTGEPKWSYSNRSVESMSSA